MTHLKLTPFCCVGDEADDKDKVAPGGDVDDDDDPENRCVPTARGGKPQARAADADEKSKRHL